MESSDQVYIAFKKVSPRTESKKSETAPIILLHGITSSKETWEEVVQPIADLTGREVFALDSRNHGDSGWNDDLSTDSIAQDVLRFTQKMNFSKVVVIGHSFGGRAAMKLSLKEPNLVEKLVVEDISPKRFASSNRYPLTEYIQLQKKLIEHIPSNIHDINEAKKILNNLMCSTELSDKTFNGVENTNGFYLGIKEENGKFIWKANLDLLEKFAAGKLPPTPDYQGLFEKPVLFLYGTNSPFKVDKDEEVIKSFFPNSTLKGFETDHQIHLREPEKFVEEVAKFLNSS